MVLLTKLSLGYLLDFYVFPSIWRMFMKFNSFYNLTGMKVFVLVLTLLVFAEKSFCADQADSETTSISGQAISLKSYSDNGLTLKWQLDNCKSISLRDGKLNSYDCISALEYFKNGTLKFESKRFKGTLGNITGYERTYFENGKIRYETDLKTEITKIYTEDGKLFKERQFDKSRNGTVCKTYNNTGELMTTEFEPIGESYEPLQRKD